MEAGTAESAAARGISAPERILHVFFSRGDHSETHIVSGPIREIEYDDAIVTLQNDGNIENARNGRLTVTNGALEPPRVPTGDTVPGGRLGIDRLVRHRTRFQGRRHHRRRSHRRRRHRHHGHIWSPRRETMMMMDADGDGDGADG